MIEELDRELTKATEDLDRALYVEALRLADETSKHSFSQPSIVDPQGFGVERAEREQVERERLERERLELVEREQNEQDRMERDRMERDRMERDRVEQEQAERERTEQERVEREQEFLFRRLKPVEAGYHRDLCCMDSTRQSLLNQVTDWVANKSEQENVLQRNAYWFYGSPGIGKASLAHSICAVTYGVIVGSAKSGHAMRRARGSSGTGGFKARNQDQLAFATARSVLFIHRLWYACIVQKKHRIHHI